ncbi:hypothetical protein L7F22_021326 [Adiantum nelumboides]|nr:hypothetical protein [Adiantum nelumboides]
MQNRFASSQSPENWPQQDQMHAIRPPSESSFEPPQFALPMEGQPSQSQTPFGRPFAWPQQPGMRPSPDSFPFMPPQAQFGSEMPAFPATPSQNNARPISQPLQMRLPTQPNMVVRSPAQNFLPRGFQQQVTTMPQPPASTITVGNFGQIGVNQQNQFSTPTMFSPQSSPGVTRQQAGPSLQANQVPSNFTMQRMQPPSALWQGPQLRAPAPPFLSMNAQLQQAMRPQQGIMPPMQLRMQPQMARQGFSGPPQSAPTQQNFAHLPVAGGLGHQQAFNRSPSNKFGSTKC